MALVPADQFAVEHKATGTVLTGLLDQAALYGVLAYLEMLGVNLVEVWRVADRDEPPAGGSSAPDEGAESPNVGEDASPDRPQPC